MITRKAPPLFGSAANGVELAWSVFEWAKTHQGHQYYETFALNFKDPEQYIPWQSVSELEWSCTEPFANAPLFLVTAEMMQVALFAAATFEDQPLLEEDLPAPAGVMMLDGNYPYMTDKHNNQVGTCAFTWIPGQTKDPDPRPGIFMSMWADDQDPQDDVSRSHWNAKTRWQWSDMPRIQLSHAMGWTFGSSTTKLRERIRMYDAVAQRELLEDTLPLDGTMSLLRVFLTLCTLMRQRIAVRTDAHFNRQTIRDWERRRKVPPEIKVITLRRHYNPGREKSENPKTVDWASRWMVGGHWRRHWYPSIQDHRQIYIAPYIKGPEGKTLRLHDEVYKLSR